MQKWTRFCVCTCENITDQGTGLKFFNVIRGARIEVNRALVIIFQWFRLWWHNWYTCFSMFHGFVDILLKKNSFLELSLKLFQGPSDVIGILVFQCSHLLKIHKYLWHPSNGRFFNHLSASLGLGQVYSSNKQAYLIDFSAKWGWDPKRESEEEFDG